MQLLEDSLEDRLDKAGGLLSDSEKTEGDAKEGELDENKVNFKFHFLVILAYIYIYFFCLFSEKTSRGWKARWSPQETKEGQGCWCIRENCSRGGWQGSCCATCQTWACLANNVCILMQRLLIISFLCFVLCILIFVYILVQQKLKILFWKTFVTVSNWAIPHFLQFVSTRSLTHITGMNIFPPANFHRTFNYFG